METELMTEHGRLSTGLAMSLDEYRAIRDEVASTLGVDPMLVGSPRIVEREDQRVKEATYVLRSGDTEILERHMPRQTQRATRERPFGLRSVGNRLRRFAGATGTAAVIATAKMVEQRKQGA